MTLTALLLSTALAFFTGAEDVALKPAAPAKSDFSAEKAVQEAEPAAEDQPGEAEPARPEAEPTTPEVEPGAEPLPEPETVSAATVVAESQAGAERAAAWFDSVTTLRARFVQTAPDGARSEGVLSLQRPGRVRLEYDDPSPILMVADGSTVAIADFELETIDRAPIRSTPLRYLLGGTDVLAEAVTEAGRSGGRLYVTLVDPDGEVDGRLTLVFDDPDPDAPASDMVLSGWFAVDAMGGLTELNLTDAERAVRFDPRLFILDDEDVIADDRRTRRR